MDLKLFIVEYDYIYNEDVVEEDNSPEDFEHGFMPQVAYNESEAIELAKAWLQDAYTKDGGSISNLTAIELTSTEYKGTTYRIMVVGEYAPAPQTYGTDTIHSIVS
jgi:hypothetical protein